MNLPEFYKKTFYHKEIVVELTDKSIRKTRGSRYKYNVGEKLSLSIEVSDILEKPDCKVGSFSANFYVRTPHGRSSKAYESEKQLEKSVRLMLANYGFKFVEWKQTID